MLGSILTRPTRLRVTRAAGAGGDGNGKGRKTLSLAFLLPITPLAPLRRDRDRDDWGRVSLIPIFALYVKSHSLQERNVLIVDCHVKNLYITKN